MKIKFFNLLIAMTLTTAIWAAPATVAPAIEDDPATECADHLQLSIELDALHMDESELQQTLDRMSNLLEDDAECNVTVTIKVGPSWGAVEVAVNFSVDCDQLVAAIKAKVKQLNEAIK